MTDRESTRERALARDLEARARLAADPVAQVVMRRSSGVFQRPRELGDLTAREIQVLTYLSRGLDYEMVADALGVNRESVKTHAKSARTKLRAKNSTQACCEAIRRGLIP